MTIGIAVCTYNRPEYAERCIKSVRKHLFTIIDHLVVVNDGSDPKHNGAYGRVKKATESVGGTYLAPAENAGVAATKNVGLRSLLDKGCDWVFTLEDDILIQSGMAVTEYVRIAEKSGWHHFSFAHHGPANVGVPLEDGDISFFPHSVGAWSIYSRECLEKVGLFDTHFLNAMEHVELSLRIAMAGYTTTAYQWADCTHSADWLSEIRGSIERSSIRPRSDWSSNIRNSLIYWRDEKPESFVVMFGPGKPLEQWAASIIG